MRLLVVVALASCGKSDRAAPQTGSGSSVAKPRPDRCSGRWTGRIKWDSQNCSDATIADVAPFDVTVTARESAWVFALAQPANAKLHASSLTWDQGCHVALEYDVPLPKPRTARVHLDLMNGGDGQTAHARLEQFGLEKSSCTAVGLASLEFAPDDGRVPEVPATHRAYVGNYEVGMVWGETSCPDSTLYPTTNLTYSIALDERNQFVATGLDWKVDKIESTERGLVVTSHRDIRELRQVFVQELAPGDTGVLGNVSFSVLDGDLVTCKREGTLRGVITR